MGLRIRRRLGRYGLTVVGLAVGTLIIGVAYALITVSITGTVASNEFATTTTTVAPTTTTTLAIGDGLQAAVSTAGAGSTPCANAITAGSMTLGTFSFDLNNATGQQAYSPQAFLCVTNTLDTPADEITTLTVEATVVSSTEDTCSGDEATADPDGPGCGTASELHTVVNLLIVPDTLGDAGCLNTSAVVALGGGPVSLLQGGAGSALSFGAFCSWEVRLQLIGSATYIQKLAASTDSIAVTLEVKGSNL
jgi:hypothetical protein